MLNNPQFVSDFIDKAEKIFIHPGNEYSWDSIITGVLVNSSNATHRKMAAVDKNTFRGFHKIDKGGVGAGDIFKREFLSRKNEILGALKSVQTRRDLHKLENKIREDIKSRLTNIKPRMLTSYNKIRKPLDLYFEHLVAMANEISPFRRRLVKFLFLPLDSQIFQYSELFSTDDLNRVGISRKSTYTNVVSERAYLTLQDVARKKAKLLSQLSGKEFLPIYFDLLWNERFKRCGSNLFEANP